MKQDKRERLIEHIGIEATTDIESLESQLAEVREFLKVVRVAHTRGFVLNHQPEQT